MRDNAQKQRPPAQLADNFPFTYYELARAVGFGVRHTKRHVHRWQPSLLRLGLMDIQGHRTVRFSANAAPWLRKQISQAAKGGK